VSTDTTSLLTYLKMKSRTTLPPVNEPTVRKNFKKKKEYISVNGTVVKSTVDTGLKRLRRQFAEKSSKVTNSNHIPSQFEGNSRLSNPHERVSVPQERPYSLPNIEKPSISVPPLRSSTGDSVLRRSIPVTSSQNSLSLMIDVSSHNSHTTAKEKRQWRDFSTLTEDCAADNNSYLHRVDIIGKGSSAYVYKSVLFPSLVVVADKVVVLSNKEKSSQIVRELKSLSVSLNDERNGSMCENIVRLLEVYNNPRDGTISMCLEYMDGGSLQEVVKRGGCQNELILRQISLHIVKGLAYLHSKRQLHRDIKPGNILLSSGRETTTGERSKGAIKISDFGLSKELEKGHSLADSFLGTFHYMSP
jgi:hypothetical protein